jgi:hypothetical protein
MFNFNDHLQELRVNIVSIVLLLSATIIHMTFIASAIGIAYTDLLMQRVLKPAKEEH